MRANTLGMRCDALDVDGALAAVRRATPPRTLLLGLRGVDRRGGAADRGLSYGAIVPQA